MKAPSANDSCKCNLINEALSITYTLHISFNDKAHAWCMPSGVVQLSTYTLQPNICFFNEKAELTIIYSY